MVTRSVMEQTPDSEVQILTPLRSAGKSQLRYRCIRVAGGFSLIELLVVIAVTMALTALLMPALQHVHENAHRLICGSHLNQLGQAFYLYHDNSSDRLPYSAILQEDSAPADLMAAQHAQSNGKWDGIGRLFAAGYCPSPECFYCPSHHGDHSFDRYEDKWHQMPTAEPIFTNYHYSGDVEWVDKKKRRSLDHGYSLVLATDGLRTAQDFNHFSGMNILRGDGSVRWRDDNENIRGLLPANDSQSPNIEYNTLWDQVTGYH
jgi:prepilin-type N-terminal cleavage/methylation domain-containing protein